MKQQLIRFALILGLTIAAVTTVVSLLTEPAVPSDYMGGFSEKFVQYRRFPQPPEMVLAGSSRVYRGLDPRQMARELPGDPLIYNFSKGGMDTPLLTKVLDFIHTERESPSLVIVEPLLPKGGFIETPFTDVSRYSHQYSNLWISLLDLAADGPTPENRKRLARILDRFPLLNRVDNPPMALVGLIKKARLFQLYGTVFFHTATGLSRLRLRADEPRELDLDSPICRNNGFYPLDQELEVLLREDGGDRAKKLRRRREEGETIDEEALRQAVERVCSQKAELPSRARRLYLDALIRRARGRGSRGRSSRVMMLFHPSKLPHLLEEQQRIMRYLRESHPEVSLLFLTRAEWEPFFRADYWFDGGHLNSRGAEVFTSLITKKVEAARDGR